LKDTTFFKQADLLLDCIPYISLEPNFAIKGGTAINFFYRNLPRLSVDIDLVYLPVEDWETTLKNIHLALQKLSSHIEKSFPLVEIKTIPDPNTGNITRLNIEREGATVKIEPNFVIRGTVFPPEKRMLVKKAQELFEKAVEAQTLSFADLFASKICAALDRQHPRDLFDVKLLLENEGITHDVWQAFMVYLISHNRPIVELLNPNWKSIQQEFETNFQGMTIIPITMEELYHTRDLLVKMIRKALTENDKKFLLSFKKGKPEWELLSVKHAQDLPAVKWKLLNIKRMSPLKRRQAYQKLADYLEKI